MRTVHENDINFAAFALAVLKPLTVEQAFEMIQAGVKRNNKYTKKDEQDMIEMRKQGMTYAAIGNAYGVTTSCIRRKIIRVKEEMKNGKGV